MPSQVVRSLAILTVLALLGVSSGYSEAPHGAPNAATPTAPFQVDLSASRIYVRVASSGRFGHEHGVQGRLISGRVALGGAGQLVFDMHSFLADTTEARQYVGLPGSTTRSDQQRVTANMLGADVLDVAHYPRAAYTIASASPLDGQAPGDPGRYQLEGQFTLHGVTQRLPLTAIVEQTAAPGILRMRGAFAILQSGFGITPYSAMGGLVGVADQLEIWGDLVLHSPSR